jgi:hypothetical protein
MWTLAFGHHEDRTPTHGYAPTREAGMSLISLNVRFQGRARRPGKNLGYAFGHAGGAIIRSLT